MVLNYLSERIVSIVFFLAVLVILGLYFFPDGTLNTLALVANGFKPILSLARVFTDLIFEIVQAVIGVF